MFRYASADPSGRMKRIQARHANTTAIEQVVRECALDIMKIVQQRQNDHAQLMRALH